MNDFKFIKAALFSMILILGVSCSKEEPLSEDLQTADAHIAPNEFASNSSKAKTYTVDFGALNDSGVSGTAELSLDGSTLTVHIMASGLEPGELHPQHIHGFADNKGNSTCPPASADTDGNGLVSIPEGAPFYGGVLVSLTPFPEADSEGNIDFMMTYEYEDGVDASLRPLQNRTIVLHGLNVEGDYSATTPVACGQIEASQGNN